MLSFDIGLGGKKDKEIDKDSLCGLIQNLGFLNKLVHIEGCGPKSIGLKEYYPSIQISTPTLPQWAYDMVLEEVKAGIKKAQNRIEDKGDQDYIIALNKVRNFTPKEQ